MSPVIPPVVAPKVIPLGKVTVTDWQGQSKIDGAITGPSTGGTPIAAKTFDDAVTAARLVKNVVDPGLRAVVDAGDGALLLRHVEMSPEAAHLFGSRSFGSAAITDSAPGLLGIFDWAHAVQVTPSSPPVDLPLLPAGPQHPDPSVLPEVPASPVPPTEPRDIPKSVPA